MIEALTIPAILLALANGIRQWRAMRERRPQRDEVQQLLALLCERLPERLERDGAPPRTVINLTAGQMAGGQQAMTDDIGLRLRARQTNRGSISDSRRSSPIVAADGDRVAAAVVGATAHPHVAHFGEGDLLRAVGHGLSFRRSGHVRAPEQDRRWLRRE